MEKSPLDELRELTSKLPTIPKLEEFKKQGVECAEYEMDEGNCISYGLMNNKNISVANTLITSGSAFPEHTHDEKEWVLVYSGMMIAYYGDKKRTMKCGDCVSFEPGVPHRVRALEDTWIIAITIPQSKCFPDAR